MLYALSVFPFIAAIIMALSSGRDARSALRLSLALSLGLVGIGLCALKGGQTDPWTWFTLWGTDATVSYSLFADGLSSWLVQLVSALSFVALLGAERQIGQRMREYSVCVFVLAGAMINCLLVTDLVLFYVFFEAMLVPTLILVALFGDEQRRSAGMQFFLYTMSASIFMLVAIWYLAVNAGSTNIAQLVDYLQITDPTAVHYIAADAQWYCFLAFLLAFAVKVPLLPFHSWQAPVYASASSGTAVLVAGVMGKIGIYGLLRIVLPLFPDESLAVSGLMMIVAGVGVVAGALLAIAQTDLKKMLAFSSLSHLSLVVLGVFSMHAAAITGAVIQMVAHGFAIAALFILVGWLERQFGHRHIDRLGALAQKVPVMAVLFVATVVCAVAVPGSASFVGEFLLLFGIAQANPQHLVWIAVIGTTVILSAVYLLRATQKVFYGPAKDDFEHIQAWYKTEALAVVPMLVCSFFFGVYAKPISGSVTDLADTIAQRSQLDSPEQALLNQQREPEQLAPAADRSVSVAVAATQVSTSKIDASAQEAQP